MLTCDVTLWKVERLDFCLLWEILLKSAIDLDGNPVDMCICSVLSDVELLSMDSTKASCWVNNKLRAHEEQWKEDDCTFCQCVDGEPHCTAMACKQSCQNPVKIPGECCPFCEGTNRIDQIAPVFHNYFVIYLYLCEVHVSPHTTHRRLLCLCSFATEAMSAWAH